ncbi:MAG TPA: photosynthetic reaction center cytochrome c subunit family protein, partial [Longimicrobium sp.]|nr:photosynthetic reaction center cytochrome c subunit family protein [Longimicrobium sp.]
CHVQQPGEAGREPRMNFASDDKPQKDKARAMMRMTRQINTELLPRVPDRVQPPVNVSCLTCHRGLPVPTTLDRVLEAAIDSGGAPAAIARYRQLREQTLVSGRYDFSEGTVSDLARRLAARGKTAEAIALLEMNGEFYPNSGMIDFQLGEIYRARGDRDRAIAYYRTALQKQPDNMQAKRRLDELTGAAPAAPPAPRP